MVPGEASVGTVAPQGRSVGGRHPVPTPPDTAPPGVYVCASVRAHPATPRPHLSRLGLCIDVWFLLQVSVSLIERFHHTLVLELLGVSALARSPHSRGVVMPPPNPGSISEGGVNPSLLYFLCSVKIFPVSFSLFTYFWGVGAGGYENGSCGTSWPSVRKGLGTGGIMGSA